MACYFACEIKSFERWFSPRNRMAEEGKHLLMMACTYDGVFGIYEISSDDEKLDFSHIPLSEEDIKLINNLKNSNPVILGLSRDEVLSEKYTDMPSFVEGYRAALEYFENNKVNCFVAESKVNRGELEKGEEYWIYFDEDDQDKVFWLDDGYFLYETSKYNFKLES